MVESDISFISSEAIRLALHEIGEELTKSSEFEIHLKSATKQGDNFLGIVHRVTYKNQSDENSESTLILKVAPTNPARREAFGSRKFFLREIHLYNDILSYFEEFQRIKCINIQRDGFKEYAKCYKSIDIEPNESLLLEDLSANGFNMIDRHTDVITADHVKLVMQSLGKFHAISFAIKDQEPNKFKELTSNLEEILFGKTQHHFRKHFDHLQRKTMSVIAGTELFDKVNIEDSFFDMAAQCVDGELAEPYAVLCHSDTWSNNTLFKCDATGKPADVRLIDWQISRYASPVTDILYYIFGCVGTELRTSHYDIFLRAYHDSLSSYLKRLGSDAEKLFPYEALLDQLRKYGKYGLVVGAMLSKAMIEDENIASDLDEMSEMMIGDAEENDDNIISEKCIAKFNKRIKDLFSDLIRLKYI